MMAPRPDDLLWVALTVWQEAGGEPFDGKLGVAFVIRNRAIGRGRSVSDVIFEAWQFSCWNTDSPTRRHLDDIGSAQWEDCYAVAAAAFYSLQSDPTHGATHYLNVEVTKQQRGDGTLPRWAADPTDQTRPDPAKVTSIIGHHTFLKL